MKRFELVQKLINEGLSEKTLVNLSDKQLGDLAERMLGEQSEQTKTGNVVMPKGAASPSDILNLTNKGINVELREKKSGVGSKVTKGHNGIPEFMDSKKLKEEKPSAGLNKSKESEDKKSFEIIIVYKDLDKDGGYKHKQKTTIKSENLSKAKEIARKKWKDAWGNSDLSIVHILTKDEFNQKYPKGINETKEWVENLAEGKFFHILTSKNEIMEMISSKINEVNNTKFPDMFKWNTLKSMDGEIKESGTTTKPAPVKPKVDPGTAPKPSVIPQIIPKQRPKAERDPETGKVIDKPVNPLGKPYKFDKGRKFNEPEEPKTSPKKKEEKKEKDKDRDREKVAA
jgi:hypothetical protein